MKHGVCLAREAWHKESVSYLSPKPYLPGDPYLDDPVDPYYEPHRTFQEIREHTGLDYTVLQNLLEFSQVLALATERVAESLPLVQRYPTLLQATQMLFFRLGGLQESLSSFAGLSMEYLRSKTSAVGDYPMEDLREGVSPLEGLHEVLHVVEAETDIFLRLKLQDRVGPSLASEVEIVEEEAKLLWRSVDEVLDLIHKNLEAFYGGPTHR